MTDLKQPLADLVEDVPRHVVPDDLAATAWAAGRRRRRLRRTAVAGALVAVVALATPVVPAVTERLPTTPAGTRSGPVADGYPQRVGMQWWVRSLPDAPGPVAAVMQRATWPGQEEGEQITVAVAEDGRQWRIPTGRYTRDYPTVSTTGRYLGYFPQNGPPYVIHDLASGRQVRFPRVKPHESGMSRWMVHEQMPAFWSPDDSRVLLRAVARRPDSSMLLGTDGTMSTVPVQGWAAGWVDADHIAWLQPGKENRRVTATVVVTDLSGSVQREVVLEVPRAVHEDSLSQWSASLSPDGTRVALLAEDSPDTVVRVFSMADGSRVGEPVDVPGYPSVCPLSWAGDSPVVPTYPGDENRVAVRVDGEPETFVASQPGLEVPCIALASSAAAGEPRGVFGTSTAAWTWWWQEALLAVAGVAGLWWLLRLRRSRRG